MALATWRAMAWEVELTPDVQEWYRSLDHKSAEKFAAAVERLRDRGPNLGRPFADQIKGSRHNRMKELRAGNMRALFAFGPRRDAVVLVAGDKTNDWRGWYQRNIPVADRRYDEHLRSVGGGGNRCRARGTGVKSAASER
jgi:hypothetical protein